MSSQGRDWLDQLSKLDKLRELVLIHYPLGRVPDAIRQFQNLRYLNLSGTGLDRLPEWLVELRDLRVLWLTGNQIQLKNSIGDLAALTVLVLIENEIENLPELFAGLGNLRALCLAENPLLQIPEPVYGLQALEGLDLRGGPRGKPGKLTVLPQRLLDLPQLRLLDVDNQPIETPPPEVVAKGLEGIRAYFRQLREGRDYVCEAKLLIVGEPGAGKTSLARKLDNPNYRLLDDQKSTEGIDVTRWRFPTHLHIEEEGQAKSLERDFQVSLWDFGGQEIYHATHQFFLTKRSLYVLVADNRKEDTDFQYWLNIVEVLSDGSPVVIVKNEKQDRRRDVNESRLRERFPNLREVLATNLETNRGLREIVRTLQDELMRLPHIGTALPKTWRRVRDALDRDKRDYIDLPDYLSICSQEGFTREDEKLQLSGFLHDLGVCLHFQNDPLLRKKVILKPRWATDAVYRVLDNSRVIENHGRFTTRDLAGIWSEKKYASMRDELVQLMMLFQLCYRLAEGHYLAPQLLGSSPPAYPWAPVDNLVVYYRYEFMPKGILPRLVVAMHPLIERDAWVWRDGVVLARGQARGEVTEDYTGREIAVRVTGADKVKLLEVIDYELEKIHRDYPRIKVGKHIPCRCARCAAAGDKAHFYDYEALLRFARDGQSIQCPLSYAMVPVGDLLSEVFPQALRAEDAFSADLGRIVPPGPEIVAKEVFVSYAWGGDSEALVDKLEQALRDRGIPILRDRSEMQYKDSIREFMRRLGRGKCIVIVLSRKYLESENCMFELTEIAECGELRKRVFPIVLGDAGVYDALTIVTYVKLWEDRLKKVNAALKKVDQENLDGVRESIDLYAKIRRTISQLATTLGDMNALTTERHLDSKFDALVRAIEAELER